MVTVKVMGGLFDHDEFGGHAAGALMQPLEEGMLAVAAFFTPCEAGGVVWQGLAVHVDALAVAFHFQLLQVGGQAAQAVVIGGNAAAGQFQKGAVPDVQQAQPDGQVAGPGLFGKVLVHGGSAADKIQKMVCTQGNGQRQAHGGPDREAPSHAFGHGQYGVDAGCGCLVRLGCDGYKVLADVCATLLPEPLHGRGGVAQGFVGGPGFGDHDEQSAFRLQALQFFLQVMAIQVGDDADGLLAVVEGQQGLQRQIRAQAGAADADMDHMGDGGIVADGLGQCQHVLHGSG